MPTRPRAQDPTGTRRPRGPGCRRGRLPAAACKLGRRRPRYPHLRVSTHSPNPLALVAAVRHELRRAGAEPAEVRRFTDQALSAPLDSGRLHRVVEEWVGGVDAG